jgi:cell pole-organizing protein PopZ
MASRFIEEGEDVVKKVGAGMGMTGAIITDKVGDLVNYFTGIKSPSAVEAMNPVMEKVWGKNSNIPTTPTNQGQSFTGSTRYGVNDQGYGVEGKKQPGAPTAGEVEKFNYGIHNYKKDTNPKAVVSKTTPSAVKKTVSPGIVKESTGENWRPINDTQTMMNNRNSIINAAMEDAYAKQYGAGRTSYGFANPNEAEDTAKYAEALRNVSSTMKEIPEAAYKEGEVPYAGDVLKSGIGLNEARSEEARASARLHQANIGKVGAETKNIGLSNKESKQRADEIKSLSVHTVTDELGQTKTVYDTGYGMEQYNKLHGIPAPEPKTDADILAEARTKAARNPSQRSKIKQYLLNNGFDPKAVDETLGK